jgi:Fur family zinc uptake transcriptional regulator
MRNTERQGLTGEGHGDCAHAARRAADAPGALSAAETACRERGVRLTRIRRDVLAALYETHRPLGAYDLAEALARRAERRVAPITVYRALEFLLEQGFIHRLATKNAFVACPHRHGPGELVAFLICETCGGVDEDASPDVGAALGRVLAKAGFAPHAQVVEIVGLCAHCRPEGKAH